MRIGAIVPMAQSDGPGRMPTWDDVRRFASHAEAVGLDSLWVCDHFFHAVRDGPIDGMHESWSLLAALATSTTHVELGQLVTCVSFRNPGLLAKMAVTTDMISGGRLTLGLGAGWHEPEYQAFGYPFDHRVSRFEEAIRIIRPLVRGESVSLDGRFHRVQSALVAPAPERSIPLLVASTRPRMLRLTARYADAWNTAWFGMPDERLLRRLADLNAALANEGRDPSTIRLTVGLEIRDPDVISAQDDGALVTARADQIAHALDAHEKLRFKDAIAVLIPMNERSLDRLAEAQQLRSAG